MEWILEREVNQSMRSFMGNHGKEVICKPEVLLCQLMDDNELGDLAKAVAKVKSEPNAWGKITLDIRNGKIKLVEIMQSIKSGG